MRHVAVEALDDARAGVASTDGRYRCHPKEVHLHGAQRSRFVTTAGCNEIRRCTSLGLTHSAPR